MVIPIKTDLGNFFSVAIKVLNPVLKLSNTETNVLANILLVLYANRNIDKNILEEELLSYKSRVAIRSKLNISEASLNNNISSLKKKGILVKTKNGFNISKPIEVLMPIKNKLSVSFNIEVHE